MLTCNQEIQSYFDSLTNAVKQQYELASVARAQNKDPEPHVDIFLARTVAERTEALIASVAPQILKSGVAQRITELETKYGPGDWRVSLLIAEEVAQEKFCKFKDLKEAIEIGIRVGFAYITNGVTSAPLEGLVEIKFKKRKDGKEYVALYFAGPIRNSGGTAASVSIIIADYLRRKFNIPDYDITDEEVKRYQVEIEDYVTKVAHRQYVPTAKEIETIVRGIKVEITGDPTEKYEVSQCKHLERVETDLIRGGMALVLTEGPSLKAEKLWKQISKFGSEFGLESWFWLKDFIKLKTSLHTKSSDSEQKIVPINTYLADVVAGRPVFSYPMRLGGFRLRYGRSRLSGFASMALHPATGQVLAGYIATGTQVKTERPGKATAVTFCDSIEGPIVKLQNGSVMRLQNETEAKTIRSQIAEILFLGDLLVNYGDFSENGARLAPAGYNEEWWAEEFKKAANTTEIKKVETAAEAVAISEKFSIPLHPQWTYHWNAISSEQFLRLQAWLKKLEQNSLQIETEAKIALENIGCPHTVIENKVIFADDDAYILNYIFKNSSAPTGKTGLECINSISKIKLRDKSGTFVGTRMGRPEKAKLRALKGSPTALFPIGKEGGRLRSLQAAIEKGAVFADFPILHCQQCNETTLYTICPKCNSPTEQWRICPLCKKKTKSLKCHTHTVAYEKRKISPKDYLNYACRQLQVECPALVKAVRGTWNKDHVLENLSKGILRAIHLLTVNKDGTIRYDMTELGTTHFKPVEIGASVEKLKQLGYSHDKDNQPLENENQIIEIFPQDVILPACPEAADEGADKILLRTCAFIDDLLEKFYKLPRYYNAKTKEDLIGQLIIGLAPHTSCGITGRIIGFSKTQACIAHQYWHSAQRRNFDGDENGIILLMDAFLNFSRRFLPDRRGGRSVTSDTTVYIRRKGKIQTVEIGKLITELFEKYSYVKENDYKVLRNCPEQIEAVSFDKTGKASFSQISTFISHPNDRQIFRIKTTNGYIKVTEDHSLFITQGSQILPIAAKNILPGQAIVCLNSFELNSNQPLEIDALKLLDSETTYITPEPKNLALIKASGFTKRTFAKFGANNPYRYVNGTRAAPYSFYLHLGIEPNCKVRAKADSYSIKRKFNLNEDFYKLLGFILAEGAVTKRGIEVTNTSLETITYFVEICSQMLDCKLHIQTDRRTGKYKKGVCYKVNLPKIFAEVLYRLGLNTQKAREKEVPYFVFETKVSNIKAFLDGFLLGDGTKATKARNLNRLFTSSTKLAAGLGLLCNLAGYKSGIHQTKDGKYQISYSKLNNTDPFWPLWELTKDLYRELRKAGYKKEEISRLLANVRARPRRKTTSLDGLNKILAILPEGKLKAKLCLFKNSDLRTERVVRVEKMTYKGEVYDFSIPHKENFLCGPHPIFAHNTMDAPLVLTTVLDPTEVDTEVHGMDIVDHYPLEFYEAAQNCAWPWEIKIEQVKHRLGTEAQYCGLKYTHEVSNMNMGIIYSAYKSIPTMIEKMEGQLELAKKIRAVDFEDVVRLVLDRHFIRDIKGNLRGFTTQEFRCVACNTKFRRVPLQGTCTSCGGKILFTISEGNIRKYLEASLKLVSLPGMSLYIQQSMELLKRRIDSIFGREATKQIELKSWFA